MSACVLRDDNKYKVFLDLEMKLSGVSSSAVKWARRAKRTPDFSSQKVTLSIKEQLKISTYLMVVNSSDQGIFQSGRNVRLSAQYSDSLEKAVIF